MPYFPDSNIDLALLATSSGGLLGDWMQTHDIINKRNSPLKTYEENPILGKHPTRKDVNAYFGTMLLGNYAGGMALPQKQRRALWGAVTAAQAAQMLKNKQLGLNFHFDF